VLNELSGHVTQYAIDPGKGTLMLVDSISWVPVDAGLVWGRAPQASVGATPAPTTAAPKDDKLKVWAADIQITPNSKFLYSSERTTNKIAPFKAAAETGKLAYVTNFGGESNGRATIGGTPESHDRRMAQDQILSPRYETSRGRSVARRRRASDRLSCFCQ
jgi:6-phosphogluconolactonase